MLNIIVLFIALLINNRHNTIMRSRTALLYCVVLWMLAITSVEGRTKKVVIHVPVKMKKIKHTHTIYKTIHHHHTHHEPYVNVLHTAPTEEHEHFHHMHIHEELPSGQHSQPVPGIRIPEFLPDVPDTALEVPNVSHEIPGLPSRHVIPLYRRKKDLKGTEKKKF